MTSVLVRQLGHFRSKFLTIPGAVCFVTAHGFHAPIEIGHLQATQLIVTLITVRIQ
jgi:hypothetical protein